MGFSPSPSWAGTQALGLTLALTAARATAEHPADVRAWAEAYDHASLGGPGLEAAGRVLEWDHLRLELAAGRLYPVTVAGRAAGVYFTGTGRLRYVSAEPLEAAVFRRNVDAATSLRLDPDGALAETVSSAVAWLPVSAEALAGAGGWPGGAAPAAAEQAFEQQRQSWSAEATPRQMLAQAALDPPPEELVVLQAHGAHEELFYVRDTLRGQEEALGVVRKLGEGRRWYPPLSHQPRGRDRLAAGPAPLRLVALDLDLANPRGAEARLTLRETFELLAPARTLALGLADDLGPAYELRSVRRDGRELAFARGAGELVVDLGRRAEAGQRVELELALGGDVLVRPGGDNYWLLLGGWYPRPLDPQATLFSFHGVVRTPAPFVAFSVGKLLRRWQEDGLECAEFRSEAPVDLVTVLAGKYTTVSESRGALTVQVSSYGNAKPDASRRLASLVHAFAAFYEPLLGPLPFPELQVFEINSYGFGVAPPGVVFITKEAFGVNPVADPVANLVVKGINRRVAHEVAHAWWGNAVVPARYEDHWLSESLAEYYAALAMTLRGKGEYDEARAQWREESDATGSVYLASFLVGDGAWRDRRALLYARGPLMLHALRQELGDQAFFSIFKSLVRSFPGKPAGTRDVLTLARLVTGQEQRPFFDRYLFGTELARGKK